MISEVRKRMERRPFVPFIIRSTDGHEYSVPTVDHLWMPPRSSFLMVATDDGGAISLWALHIAALVESSGAAATVEAS